MTLSNPLLVPELAELICNEVQDKSSLLSLALSCQSTLLAALDALWRTIESFDPLLRCLPGDSWEERSVPFSLGWTNHSKVFPVRMLMQSDLQRYLACYAPRIRSFNLRPSKNTKILSRDFWEALQLATSGSPPGALAPRLREFHWMPSGVPNISGNKEFWAQIPYATQLFVGGSEAFSSFGVKVPSPGGGVAVPMDPNQQMHHLKTLVLEVSSPLCLHLFDYFLKSSQWLHLESLTVTGLTASSIPHLASLPRLAALNLTRVMGLTPDYADIVSGNEASFPSLREIRMQSCALRYLTNLLAYLPPANQVQHVECRIWGLSSPLESQEVIGIMHHRLSPSRLKVVDIQDAHFSDGEQAPKRHLIMAENPADIVEHFDANIDISPLFQFSHLEKLAFRVHPRVQVTPTDAMALGSAFPNLKHLDLRGSFPIHRLPVIDHTDVLRILEQCPSLRTLGLPFDGRGIVGEERSSQGPFGLETFLSSGSPIDSPSSVATFLKGCVPGLSRLVATYQSWLETDDANESRWKEVERWMEHGLVSGDG